MTQRDRDALRAVVKGRFEVLSGELSRRQQELRQQISDEVEKEFSDKKEKYENALEELKSKAKDLELEGRRLIRQAAKEGIEVGRYGELVEAKVRSEVNIADSYKITENRYQEILNNSGVKTNLRSLELTIIEGILTSDMGEDAKKILAQIPSVDQLLPLPGKPKPKALKR